VVREDVVSFDDEATTVVNNEVVGGSAVNNASDYTAYRYPVVPEEFPSADPEHNWEDTIPKDFDLEQQDLSVVAMRDPASEIFSGRANCQCGRPGERNYPLRIVNGTVVPINDLPWTVALVRKSWLGQPSGAYCGGTLINSQYVLTASHCVDGMQASQIQVLVHEEDFASQTEVDGGTQRFGVEKIIMHPYYSRRTVDNDVALLRLADKGVTLDHVVVPACLPANNDYDFSGINATVAGWGATAEGSSVSSTLMKVDVPIISNQDCNTKTKYVGKITENMLCAGLMEGGKDSCQGDSGGPLTIENGGRRTLVGIVSWGYGCARPESPGVYTRVGRYSNWIVANTKDAKWCNA